MTTLKSKKYCDGIQKQNFYVFEKHKNRIKRDYIIGKLREGDIERERMREAGKMKKKIVGTEKRIQASTIHTNIAYKLDETLAVSKFYYALSYHKKLSCTNTPNLPLVG